MMVRPTAIWVTIYFYCFSATQSCGDQAKGLHWSNRHSLKYFTLTLPLSVHSDLQYKRLITHCSPSAAQSTSLQTVVSPGPETGYPFQDFLPTAGDFCTELVRAGDWTKILDWISALWTLIDHFQTFRTADGLSVFGRGPSKSAVRRARPQRVWVGKTGRSKGFQDPPELSHLLIMNRNESETY